MIATTAVFTGVPHPDSATLAMGSITSVMSPASTAGLNGSAVPKRAMCLANYDWMNNGKGQSPCVLAGLVLDTCANNSGMTCSIVFCVVYVLLILGRSDYSRIAPRKNGVYSPRLDDCQSLFMVCLPHLDSHKESISSPCHNLPTLSVRQRSIIFLARVQRVKILVSGIGQSYI